MRPAPPPLALSWVVLAAALHVVSPGGTPAGVARPALASGLHGHHGFGHRHHGGFGHRHRGFGHHGHLHPGFGHFSHGFRHHHLAPYAYPFGYHHPYPSHPYACSPYFHWYYAPPYRHRPRVWGYRFGPSASVPAGAHPRRLSSA